MSGQNRKDPFHVNRDVVKDNLKVVRKLRLPRGAQIRARVQYATVNNAQTGQHVVMPYTGNLFLTTTGANDVVINNPFVNASTPLNVNSGAGSVAFTSPGQFLLSGTAAGVVVISVGRPIDIRPGNRYSS